MFKKIKVIFLVVVLLMCFVGCGAKENTKQIFFSNFHMYIPESWESDEYFDDLDTMGFYSDFSDESVHYMLFVSTNANIYKITSADLVADLKDNISKDYIVEASDVISVEKDDMIGYYVEYKGNVNDEEKYYRDYIFTTDSERISLNFTTNKNDFSKIEKVVDTLKADNFD